MIIQRHGVHVVVKDHLLERDQDEVNVEVTLGVAQAASRVPGHRSHCLCIIRDMDLESLRGGEKTDEEDSGDHHGDPLTDCCVDTSDSFIEDLLFMMIWALFA